VEGRLLQRRQRFDLSEKPGYHEICGDETTGLSRKVADKRGAAVTARSLTTKEWNQPSIMLRGMQLGTLLDNCRRLSWPQREIAQNLLIERLDDTVTAIHQNADPPGSALREQLDQTKAAIQENPDAADAQRALVDLTQSVIDTLDKLGRRSAW
jgi:hypothetical protein